MHFWPLCTRMLRSFPLAPNKYGHPSVDVLRALSQFGAEVLRTDEAGTVIVRTDGARIEIEAGGDRWQVAHDSSEH